jgi:hypothetical protein
MAAGDEQILAGRMSAIDKQLMQRSVGAHWYRTLTELHNDFIETYKDKVLPVLDYLKTMSWRLMGKWRCSYTILDLGTRWRWMVSFTPLSLYLREKRPQYPIYMRLGGPQSRPRSCGGETNLLPLPRVGPRTSSTTIAITTKLSRILLY